MNRWLDRIQIWDGGHSDISYDLSSFWDESIESKVAAEKSNKIISRFKGLFMGK